MFLMVILRNVVKVETLDFSTLVKVRAPQTPAFTWDAAAEDWTFIDKGAEKSADLDPFFRYASYPTPAYYDLSAKYELSTDYAGPAFFLPSDCLKINSF